MVWREEAGWQVKRMDKFGTNMLSLLLASGGVDVVRLQGICAAK